MPRYDEISQLPEPYQAQIRRKMRNEAPDISKWSGTGPETAPKEPKYGNRKTEVDGIRFDSKKEAKRYVELKKLYEDGKIFSLRLQQDFTLQEACTTPEGIRVRAIRYKADFVYYRQDELGGMVLVVEDVKSQATKTKQYAMKKKMMVEKFGIYITEIY